MELRQDVFRINIKHNLRSVNSLPIEVTVAQKMNDSRSDDCTQY